MTKPTEQLDEFITRARTAGKTDAEITASLVQSGWDEQVVATALRPADLVPPAPPAPKSSAREIFFYLLQFFTLGITATSLGGIIFAVINRYIPDEVAGYYPSTSAVHWPLASLIVVAPVFAGVTWKLVKDIHESRTSARSVIRRVLTYIALFLASATVIGDVIALVFRFLAGQVNTRFVLKVITILLIGLWVIYYYYTTVKRDERSQPQSKNWHKVHGMVFGVVTVVLIVLGFMVNGTPAELQRQVRDQERVNNLNAIQYAVQDYHDKYNKLPETLTILDQGYTAIIPTDPLTGESYTYEPGQDRDYRLCANFESASPQDNYQDRYAYPLSVNWSHPAGYYCFNVIVQQIKTP